MTTTRSPRLDRATCCPALSGGSLKTRNPKYNWAFTRKRCCRRVITGAALAMAARLTSCRCWRKRVGPIGTLYGNVGYWWQTAADKHNYWYAGAVLEREVNERLTLGVELLGNTAKERTGRSDVAFNVGGSWKLSKQVNLLFSTGRDIVGDTRAMVYLGLQVLTK